VTFTAAGARGRQSGDRAQENSRSSLHHPPDDAAGDAGTEGASVTGGADGATEGASEAGGISLAPALADGAGEPGASVAALVG
jgi:hypothetical protein